MDILADFLDKGMIEQITLLEEIKEAHQVTAIDSLLELYCNRAIDRAVHEMIYHALYDLLADQEDTLLTCLHHPSAAVRLLCLRRAGDSQFRSALPILRELLQGTDDPRLMVELLRALGNYNDPALKELVAGYLDSDDFMVAAEAEEVLLRLG